jgi:hypothetical protein
MTSYFGSRNVVSGIYPSRAGNVAIKDRLLQLQYVTQKLLVDLNLPPLYIPIKRMVEVARKGRCYSPTFDLIETCTVHPDSTAGAVTDKTHVMPA